MTCLIIFLQNCLTEMASLRRHNKMSNKSSNLCDRCHRKIEPTSVNSRVSRDHLNNRKSLIPKINAGNSSTDTESRNDDLDFSNPSTNITKVSGLNNNRRDLNPRPIKIGVQRFELVDAFNKNITVPLRIRTSCKFCSSVL